MLVNNCKPICSEQIKYKISMCVENSSEKDVIVKFMQKKKKS